MPFAGLGGPAARGGTVYIVGGGPGDPAHLSLRAATLLATCDVVAHDHLSPTEALELVPEHADRILVGRRLGRPGFEREELDELLLARAAAGDAVVRLKGGDPFVFGRGGEEASACVAADVPFEIVPGVSSATAVPGAAGIPVTHRGVSRGFAVVTGHEAADHDTGGGPAALAAFPGTLVLLMGLTRLRSLTEALIVNGRAPDTPAAVVADGTLPHQRSVRATLGTIAEVVEEQRVATPAVIVVGDVVDLAGTLSRREHRPLHARRVLLPRSSDRPSRLAAALRHAGADVTQARVATEVDTDAATVARLATDVLTGRVERLLVADVRGVVRTRDALVDLGADVRALGGCEIVALGDDVARRLTLELGIVADRVSVLEREDDDGTTALLVPGADTHAVGHLSDVRLVATSRLEPVSVTVPEVDAVVVSASRLVDPLLAALGDGNIPTVALGPATAAALTARGRPPAAQATQATPDAVVEAVTSLLASDRAERPTTGQRAPRGAGS